MSRPCPPSRPGSTPPHRNPNSHAPTNPSGLRQSRRASQDGGDNPLARAEAVAVAGSSSSGRVALANEHTSLLRSLSGFRDAAHAGPCDHGTFSPRPASPSASSSTQRTEGDWIGSTGWWRLKTTRMGSSRVLAREHGVADSPLPYLSYYLPVLSWARAYRWSYLGGDLVAALTMAGMYLPMALSLADNLAHVPAINGLYSFVFNPLVYAFLGSSPTMVVGPEAAGSLLVGTAVRASVDRGRGGDDDDAHHAMVCGVVTGMAGATVLTAGLCRLGFLDNVLSRPFLRGFISAIGFVIAVEQLLPELGLAGLAEETPGARHGSSVEKLRFVARNLGHVHGLTFSLALASFAAIMICREAKRRLQPRHAAVALVPDRLLVVVAATVLTRVLAWDARGVAVLGEVKSAGGQLFTFRWPFRPAHIAHLREAAGTAFLIALLGFFESSVAAKALGSQGEAGGVQLSANRELVALGVANLLGACFMSLPAFGGYGRSKVNVATGGRTPASSLLLSAITLLCVLFALPWFAYLPKAVLASMISVVAWSLIEECPADVAFFVRIGAWPELGLMLIIVLATVFCSLSVGIAIGVGLSVLQVVLHATRPRMQILGRIPGTHRFECAESAGDAQRLLEFFDGCLIVKMPEPLTFANTGQLKTRLRRLERYGAEAARAHPALPALTADRPPSRNVIFDIHGASSMDGSGTQVLADIVRDYRARGVRVFFSRGPPRGSPLWHRLALSGIVTLVGEERFVADVQDALKMTELEGDEGDDGPGGVGV